MVPPASHKVSRVSWYSGSCQPLFNFAYGIFTLSDQISQNCSAIDSSTLCSPQPRGARTTVWALSISLAATLEIEVSFFSSGYLDVSVPPVPFHTLWIGVWILEVCSSGFPHSDISGSMDICSSPKLFAAYDFYYMQFSRYIKMRASHLDRLSSVITYTNLFVYLITGETSYHNSTALLIGLAVISCCSSWPVSICSTSAASLP